MGIREESGCWHCMVGASNASVFDIFKQVVTFQVGSGNSSWMCNGVYGSPTPSLREDLWNHLRHLRRHIRVPWMLIEDFNEIMLPSEVKGSVFSFARADRSASILEDCDFMDTGSIRSSFTWCQSIQGKRKMVKRLDRVVVDIR